jgi:hypothetical protein
MKVIDMQFQAGMAGVPGCVKRPAARVAHWAPQGGPMVAEAAGAALAAVVA